MTKTSLLIALLFFCFSFSAHAGKVMKVNGKKVYIVFDQDEPFTTGDYFVLNNEEGKKLGLVQIKKIKGFKAIALLKKGKAANGLTTTFKAASKKAKKSSIVASDDSSEDSGDSSSNNTASRKGLMLGYGLASQDVTQSPTLGTSAQSGSSIALRGVYDYPLFSSVYFRGMAGGEFFSVSGDGYPLSNSSVLSTVGTDITYLALDALFHWTVSKGASTNFYLLGGMGILYPMSKSSDVILEDSIDSLAIGEFGAGMEFKLNGYVIPFEIAYYYFPSGDDVTTSVISLKLGLIF